jgi:hypothetical protein
MTIGELTDSLQTRLAASAPAQSRSRSSSSWDWSDGNNKVQIVIEGRVEFTDNYSDVKSISDNGSFRLQEQRGNVTRQIEITESANGALRQAYALNGQPKEFDAEAKAWFARTLSAVIPGSGIDASTRVTKTLKQGGPTAVLKEAARLSDDRSKRIYFQELFKSDDVDPGILRDALQQLSSDYERGNLLVEVSERFLGQANATSILFDSVRRVSSSYEQRRILSAMLKKNVSRDALLQVLKSATTLLSDFDKASFLLDNSAIFLHNPVLRSALISAIDSIHSEYERHRVQSALLK